MADPTTTNRTLAVPTRGSDVGTWDVPVNGNMALLDTIVGGVTAIASTGGTTTLNAAQLANGTISVTGTMASSITLLFPAVQGWWSVENLTLNNANFALLVASGTGTTVIGIPPGEVVDIQINGNTPKYRNLGRVGTYIDFASSTGPPWISSSTVPPYLACIGQSFSSGTYPYLAEYLGGTTLPDFRGSSPFYLNQGTGRLTSAGAGIDGNTLLAAGGNNGVTLATNQVPALSGANNIVVTPGGGAGIPITSSPGNVAAVEAVNQFGPVIPSSTAGAWSGIGSLSGTNTITVNPSGATSPVQSITRGVVAGIRWIRAA